MEQDPGRSRTLFGVRRELYLCALAAACFLNYYFIQVKIQIDTLPALTVFYAKPPATMKS